MKTKIHSAVLGFALIIMIVLRLPAFFAPLWDIDEGVMAANAVKLMEGGVLYKDAADHRAPLLTYLYALIFQVFGKYNLLAIKCVLLLMIAILLVLIYAIALKAIGQAGAMGAVLFWVMFSSKIFDIQNAYAFNTEWCLIFCSTCGVYLFIRSLRSTHSLIMSACVGVAFACAFFSKQPGIFDFLGIVCFLLYLLLTPYHTLWFPTRTAILRYGIGLGIGFLATCGSMIGYFIVKGAWREFLFYFFTYNLTYYPAPLSLGMRLRTVSASFYKIAAPLSIGVFVTVAVVIVICKIRAKRHAVQNEQIPLQVFLVIWAFLSFLGASASERQFAHYYIQLFPAWSLLAGITIQAVYDYLALRLQTSWSSRRVQQFFVVAWACLFGAIAIAQGAQMQYFEIYHASREIKKLPLFRVVEYLQQNSQPEDTIFVWGFFSQIYVLTQRDAASRYSYCTFLTGANVKGGAKLSGEERQRWIVPGAMDNLMQDLSVTRPLFIIDTASDNYFEWGEFPISNYPALHQFVTTSYAPDVRIVDHAGHTHFYLYRRKDTPD